MRSRREGGSEEEEVVSLLKASFVLPPSLHGGIAQWAKKKGRVTLTHPMTEGRDKRSKRERGCDKIGGSYGKELLLHALLTMYFQTIGS